MSVTDAPDGATPPIDYILCGLRVRSERALPELLAWTGGGRPVDLHIRWRAGVEWAEGAISIHPLIQVAPDGRCRFSLSSVGTYVVSADGRAVTIVPAEGVDGSEVRLFLFGTVFAIICQRLGLLPLHACCVRVGDTAVAFAGESGVGKSTLAAGLRQRGFSILADDTTVLDLTGAAGPMVLPSFPRVRLWRDSLEQLGYDARAMGAVRPSIDKYHVPVDDGFCAEPLPLSRLVLLGRKADMSCTLRTLSAVEAIGKLGKVVYRPRLMLRLGTQVQQTGQYLRVLAATGGLRALRRPETAAEWDAVVAALRAGMA